MRLSKLGHQDMQMIYLVPCVIMPILHILWNLLHTYKHLWCLGEHYLPHTEQLDLIYGLKCLYPDTLRSQAKDIAF